MIDIPPVAASILWIRQIDAKLTQYMKRIEDVLGRGWENHVEGMSDLTTSILESGHAMPQCSYTLHRDSPNGPILRYARVGDIVFHVWDCPSDVYAMLIHTCYILDGQGGEHQVLN
ncbi:unnamed protein product [Gongylonema pulchrum]|uniref:DHC_N1 domain-containing protein n=1 Tax=Gongylonema pulchrum TaxID=637853 RepID=A0A183EKY7_9BILA|nr:unnamed protein product [Gongylonema pulchrum]